MTHTVGPAFIGLIVVFNNHGRPSPRKMSKTLDPIELDTAISPYPLRATNTDAIVSGTDVPAARNVIPITVSGMPSVYPVRQIIHTITYENSVIQTIDIRKVNRNHLAKRSELQFGIVKKNRNSNGQLMNHFMKSENDSKKTSLSIQSTHTVVRVII